jgi:hypothetical protein
MQGDWPPDLAHVISVDHEGQTLGSMVLVVKEYRRANSSCPAVPRAPQTQLFFTGTRAMSTKCGRPLVGPLPRAADASIASLAPELRATMTDLLCSGVLSCGVRS